MRRAATIVVALALVLGACSKPDVPEAERVAGTVGPSDVAGDGGASAAPADGTGSAATAPPPSAPSSAPADEAGRVAGADQALVAYFDALGSEDFAAAQRVSTGNARFMVRIRELVARYNAERDGVATQSYSARSFQVASTGPTSVSYGGRAQLDSTVSGPAGDPYSASALFENPVVSFEDGTWRVSAYEYDGQPLERHPAAASASVAGVELRLQGTLDFGSSTGLVIDLVTDTDHGVKVEDVTLRYADGTTGASTLGALISREPAALYFLFDRRAAKPVAWSANVVIDEGTSNETTDRVTLGF